MGKLMAEPELEQLVPHVRMLYGHQSHFLWTDDAGTTHTIEQGEGGEQGDPLMPALFALAQHEALVEAQRRMHSNDHLFAFLDDIYVATTRDRAWNSFCAVTQEVAERAGVHTHEGKLRIWCRGEGTAQQASKATLLKYGQEQRHQPDVE